MRRARNEASLALLVAPLAHALKKRPPLFRTHGLHFGRHFRGQAVHPGRALGWVCCASLACGRSGWCRLGRTRRGWLGFEGQRGGSRQSRFEGGHDVDPTAVAQPIGPIGHHGIARRQAFGRIDGLPVTIATE
jgi:hypothetical protein